LLTVRKKHVYLLLKTAVVAASYSYVVYRLKSYRFADFETTFHSESFLFIALILMPLNWFLESKKWQILVSDIQEISNSKAFIGVFCGVTASVFTPNRIGELGGRVVVLSPENRLKGVFATLAGSLSQLTVTILAGILGVVFFSIFFFNHLSLEQQTSAWIIALAAFVLGGFALWLLFNLDIFARWLKIVPFLRKRTDSLNVLQTYSASILQRVLQISTFRYFVFASQFYCLLIAFNLNISVLEAFVGISLTYLVMATLPSITLAELGIRGSLSLFFFGFFSQNELGIVAASSVLWLINLAIPTIIGSFFLLKIKFS